MVYIPPSCSDINFSIAGFYSPPACYDLNFDIGANLPPEVRSTDLDIVLSVQDMKFFDGPGIHAVNFSVPVELGNGVVDPVWLVQTEFINVPIDFDSIITSSPTEADLPKDLALDGFYFPWNYSEAVDTTFCHGWNPGVDIREEFSISWVYQSSIDYSLCSGWSEFPTIGFTLCSGWSIHHNYIPFSVCTSYVVTMENVDPVHCSGWNSYAQDIFCILCIGYDEPLFKQVSFCVSYGFQGEINTSFCIGFDTPLDNDTYFSISWGPFSYYLLCYQDSIDKYTPPYPCQGIQFKFPNKYPLISDVCEGIQFNLNNYSSVPNDPRCPWHYHHSGIRDNNPLIDIFLLRYPAPQGVYYMLNTLYISEAISGRPIEALGISITTDRSSWLWQFTMTVASLDCLEIIKPVDGVFAHILIEINGYQWLCTVEGWDENRTLTRDSWNIYGRSTSLLFGAPISKQKSGTYGTGANGAQIFDDFVQNEPVPLGWPSSVQSWTADWTAVQNGVDGFSPYLSWYVPGNTLSYSNTTTKDILKNITDAIGAFIQTDPKDPVLKVLPMYAHQPWNWTDTNSNIDWIGLIEDQFSEIGRKYVQNPYYQAVQVLGEINSANSSNNGADQDVVFVKACRDGYCGSAADYAPMITHPLITTTNAGRERGRIGIASGGEWVNHTLKISVLCSAASHLGLFTPGDMVSVVERNAVWFGQVTGTTVAASVDLSKGVVVVNQVLEVEEYIGD
jgi:hypothetical protein